MSWELPHFQARSQPFYLWRFCNNRYSINVTFAILFVPICSVYWWGMSRLKKVKKPLRIKQELVINNLLYHLFYGCGLSLIYTLLVAYSINGTKQLVLLWHEQSTLNGRGNTLPWKVFTSTSHSTPHHTVHSLQHSVLYSGRRRSTNARMINDPN
jgi:hypothetical protein